MHTDAKAAQSTKSVNAQAYAVGTDVVFQHDRYAPETDSGRRMLAHELTHVIQQKSGPVSGTPVQGGINRRQHRIASSKQLKELPIESCR